MTRLLVSVTSAEEAIAALDAGAAFIDAKDPARGALGALPARTVASIVAAVGDRGTVTAALGDDVSLGDAKSIADAGPAYVKASVPAGAAGAELLTMLGRSLKRPGCGLVAVFAADRGPDLTLVPAAAEAGFSGIMLDTTEKSAGLLAALDLATIAHFVAAARRARLMVGLAGSLKVVDIGTLLPLKPDLVGFRGGVCEGEDRTKPLEPARVRAVAAALAVHGARSAASP